MNNVKTEGQCLCGKTAVILNELQTEIGVCHCSMCRKWSGGPFLGVEHGADIELRGDDHVKIFNSSDWAERAFCDNCGTHLFYRFKENGQCFVPVGLLETDTELAMDHQLFIDEKPDYYCFAEKTKEMTGEEVFAFFASQEAP